MVQTALKPFSTHTVQSPQGKKTLFRGISVLFLSRVEYYSNYEHTKMLFSHLICLSDEIIAISLL